MSKTEEEEPIEPALPPLPPGFKIRVQRWAVVKRDTDEKGRLLRTHGSFQRTKVPQDTVEVEVLEWPKRQQVCVIMGTGHRVWFSINTRRAVRMADWLIEETSWQELKKLRKERFPTKKKKEEAATSETT